MFNRKQCHDRLLARHGLLAVLVLLLRRLDLALLLLAGVLQPARCGGLLGRLALALAHHHLQRLDLGDLRHLGRVRGGHWVLLGGAAA